MTDKIAAVVDEFDPADAELARRNRAALRDAGEWKAPESVSVDQIRLRFEAYDALVDDGKVFLPLHAVDSAELTGEYVLYDSTGSFDTYDYWNNADDGRNSLSASSFSATTLAWQLRFWSSEYEPPEQPEYAGTEESVAHPTVVDAESTVSADAFFDDLLEFVEAQRESERDTRREAYEYLSPGAFHSEYGGTDYATIVDVDRVSGLGTIVKIDMPSENIPGEYGIYPGNEILVGVAEFGRQRAPEDAREALPVEAEVDSIDGSRLSAAVYESRSPDEAVDALRAATAEGATGRVAPLFNPVPYERETAAVKAIRDSPAKRQVVAGDNPVEFRPQREIDGSFSGLNEYQSEAARRAIAAEDVALIHGPPGTGKTRTLTAIVEELVEQGNRVLACAHSNQATDNLIAGGSTIGQPERGSLHRVAMFRDIDIARVGSGAVHPVVVKDYADNSPHGADVVASTMSAAHQFERDAFDVVVIDEGSQASIPATLVPFDKAEKAVIAGDHKQLPPYSSTDIHDREMEVSLFEHLIDRYGDDIATMLRRQYRMHEQIAEFPNQQFYGGNLETADQNRTWTIDDLDPVKAIHAAGEEELTAGQSYRNSTEADIAADEVATILDHGIDPSDVGVITPYTGQIAQIESALSERGIGDVKVATVDSFQGGEREAIVVSFVRSNPDGQTGFLTHPEEGPRRLNVAMTRARKRLVMVGDWDTLCGGSAESKADTYRALVDWLNKNEALTRLQSP